MGRRRQTDRDQVRWAVATTGWVKTVREGGEQCSDQRFGGGDGDDYCGYCGGCGEKYPPPPPPSTLPLGGGIAYLPRNKHRTLAREFETQLSLVLLFQNTAI